MISMMLKKAVVETVVYKNKVLADLILEKFDLHPDDVRGFIWENQEKI